MRFSSKIPLAALALLVTIPAVAGDLSLVQPTTKDANCTTRVTRIYQTADGDPVHVVIQNTGKNMIAFKLLALFSTGTKNVADGSDVTLITGATKDVVVVHNAMGGTSKNSTVRLSIPSCTVAMH